MPDLSPQLEAADLAAMFDASGRTQDGALKAVEAERDRAINAAREVAAKLKTKGINLDVDHMIRGSLLERAQIWWDDQVDRWRSRNEPEDEEVPDDALFAFDLPVALTHPTSVLNADSDVIDAEVARIVEGLTRQITVSRGRGSLRVSIPDDLLDGLSEAEDWADDENAMIEATDITAYWPPVEGAPALALCVVQADGGHVIEVKLLAHGAAAHRRFEALMADHGGRLG